eukprot:203803-Ditylum_brightwellii.AAC.2
MMEVGDAPQDGVLLKQLLFVNDGQQQYGTGNGRQTALLTRDSEVYFYQHGRRDGSVAAETET